MIHNKELLKKFSREKTYNAQRYIEQRTICVKSSLRYVSSVIHQVVSN